MRILAICVFAALLGDPALAQRVNYNHDHDADFSKYQTYRWVEIEGGEQLDELTGRQIRRALDRELAAKGLRKLDSDDADLFIISQVAVDEEREFTAYNSDWGYGPGWRRYGWGAGITTGDVTTIQIGSVALDMYDAAAERLVWRGVASKTIKPKVTPEKREKNLEKGAAKLLKNFPPERN